LKKTSAIKKKTQEDGWYVDTAGTFRMEVWLVAETSRDE